MHSTKGDDLIMTYTTYSYRLKYPQRFQLCFRLAEIRSIKSWPAFIQLGVRRSRSHTYYKVVTKHIFIDNAGIGHSSTSRLGTNFILIDHRVGELLSINKMSSEREPIQLASYSYRSWKLRWQASHNQQCWLCDACNRSFHDLAIWTKLLQL